MPFPENKIIRVDMTIQTRYSSITNGINFYEEGASKRLDALIESLKKIRKDCFLEDGTWNSGG